MSPRSLTRFQNPAALLLVLNQPVPLEKLRAAIATAGGSLPGASKETADLCGDVSGRRASEILLDDVDSSEARRSRRALVRACDALARSAWGRVDLKPEEQVRDFLVDMVLDSPLLTRMLDFALEIGGASCEMLGIDATLASALSQLRANIVLL